MNSREYNTLVGECRGDRIIALLLCLAVLFAAASGLDYDCPWGDDYAAYINDGIAIAQGRYAEQTRLNYFMHPSDMPAEAKDGTLVYVWGYPLVLSLVYSAAGFDRTDYHSIIFYKLPSVLSLAAAAGILYLLFRRRLSRASSALLSVYMCVHPIILDSAYSIYSDVFFMMLSAAAVFMAEKFICRLDEAKPGARCYIFGAVLGLLMLACYETRLNGITVCALVLVLHAAHFLHLRKTAASGDGHKPKLKIPAAAVLPYAVFAVTAVLCGLLLPRATANTSDLLGIDFAQVLRNLKYYAGQLYKFFAEIHTGTLPYALRLAAGAAAALLICIGIINGWKSDSFFRVYMLFTALSLLTLACLPYVQGCRYLFNILPFILMALGYGIDSAYAWLKAHFRNAAALDKAARAAALLLTAAILISSVSGNLFRILRGEDVRGDGVGNAYSRESLEIYDFVKNETPEDAVIAFRKPRVMYLNTGRVGFSPMTNCDIHTLTDADYYIVCGSLYDAEEQALITGNEAILDEQYSCGGYIIYRVISEKN